MYSRVNRDHLMPARTCRTLALAPASFYRCVRGVSGRGWWHTCHQALSSRVKQAGCGMQWQTRGGQHGAASRVVQCAASIPAPPPGWRHAQLLYSLPPPSSSPLPTPGSLTAISRGVWFGNETGIGILFTVRSAYKANILRWQEPHIPVVRFTFLLDTLPLLHIPPPRRGSPRLKV